MKCDCIHYAVCRFRAEIEKALTPLIEPGFPRNPKWDEIAGAVGSWCRFRAPVPLQHHITDDEMNPKGNFSGFGG